MNTQNNRPVSLLMLVSSMLIFGSIGLFRRMIPLPSALIAFVRGAVGSLFLLILIRLRGKSGVFRSDRKTTLLLLLSGAMIGFNWILLFDAFNYTSVSVATLCYYMAPIFVILLSSLVLHERLTGRKVLCSLVAFAGMILISGVLDSGQSAGLSTKGIILGLGAGCLYAAVILLNKRISGVDPYEKTVLQLGAAALAMIPWLLITGEFTGAVWSGKTLLLLLLTGIVHTGFSYALYFGSIDSLRTQTVALFSYIDPITALILSALFLRERLTALGLAGAVLILGAAIVCELSPASDSE